MGNKSIAEVKAIEKKNREKLLKINPCLNDDSGIYFLTRIDENSIKYFYVGQAKHILQRLCGHLSGYQHIDFSIKKRGFYSTDNPYGWKIYYQNYDESELDKQEQYWILEYIKRGYQCRYNKTAGGQGTGKTQINEYRPSKGYRDGLTQGRKNLARELKDIIDKHLVVELKPEKANNKVSQKQFNKFKELLEMERES